MLLMLSLLKSIAQARLEALARMPRLAGARASRP